MGDKTQVAGLYFADDAVLRGIIHSPMKPTEVKKSAQLSEVKKENWFKRNAYWVIPVISLVVGSGLVLKVADLAIDHQFDVRLKPLNDSLKEVQIHLTTIETQQKDWTDFLKLLLPGQVKRLSGVTGPEFQKELPGVKVAFDAAKDHSVRVPKEDVKLISTQLSKSPVSDELWEAASAVIAYASPRPTPNLRSCGDIVPAAITGNFQNGHLKVGFWGLLGAIAT